MPRIVVAVPRRPDGGQRDRLWSYCQAWWNEHAAWPVVEGHHLEGPFNRSAAINQAAGGDWDVLVVLDADVIVNADQLEAAVDNAWRTGRLTLAYDKYVSMGEATTEKVLDGYDGDWSTAAQLKMTTHVSSALAIPRRLWEQTGGFDERFEGWGHDDVAFAQACRTLGGGIDRIHGSVWHLWHGPVRKGSSAARGSAQLAARYRHAHTPDLMRRLIDERREPDGVLLVITTHGRRDCIARAAASADQNLKGLPIVRRVVSDDSGDADYYAWLQINLPDWEITAPRRAPAGFAANVAHTWDTALGSGQRHIFWLEDDFTFNRPVDMAAMAEVLGANPQLAQMALRRQPWFPNELAAGGLLEAFPPGTFTPQGAGDLRWLEHRAFWTTNPALIPRRTLIAHEWPTKAHSEALFTAQLFKAGHTAGYWGDDDDDPWVTHDGARTGTGY